MTRGGGGGGRRRRGGLLPIIFLWILVLFTQQQLGMAFLGVTPRVATRHGGSLITTSSSTTTTKRRVVVKRWCSSCDNNNNNSNHNSGHEDKGELEEDLPAFSLEKEQDPAKTVMINFIKGYKAFISPILPPACRFLPTCSEYAVESIQTFGPVKGAVLTAWRILRCNPLGGRGYDPPQWPPPAWWAGK